jgi:hypothetical protein
MNRLVMLLLFLAAGAFALYYLLFRTGRKELPSGSDAFAIYDTANVQKVYMVDKRDSSALLERHPAWGWSINGQYKARLADVKNLLETIHNVRVSRRIPQKHHDLVVTNLASQNTRIEIWSKKGELMRSYFVGWETETNEGNYMWMEGLDEIYIVNIPGFVGHLSSRFFLDENAWRDSEIFSYDLNEIRRVDVEYHPHPTILLPAVRSFTVEVVSRDSFAVTPMDKKPSTLGVDKRKVLNYLGSFEQVNYETLANGVSHKDSVLSSQHFCTMSVTDTRGRVKSIKIFYKPVSKRTKTQFDPLGNPMPYDRERFYALVNDGHDFVIIQDFVFGKLFASYEWFLAGA